MIRNFAVGGRGSWGPGIEVERRGQRGELAYVLMLGPALRNKQLTTGAQSTAKGGEVALERCVLRRTLRRGLPSLYVLFEMLNIRLLKGALVSHDRLVAYMAHNGKRRWLGRGDRRRRREVMRQAS